MKAWCVRLLLAWLASSAAGCASAPIHYYTLSPPMERAPGVSAGSPTIDLRLVNVPPQLDRVDLLIRTGPTEVTLLENERWASPLKDEIKDALRLELQRRLVRAAASSRAFATLTLDIDVRRFEAEIGRYAHLEASWRATVSDAGKPSIGEQVADCTFQADEQISAGYAGMVEGYQRAVAALADAIVVALTGAAGNEDAGCATPLRG